MTSISLLSIYWLAGSVCFRDHQVATEGSRISAEKARPSLFPRYRPGFTVGGASYPRRNGRRAPRRRTRGPTGSGQSLAAMRLPDLCTHLLLPPRLARASAKNKKRAWTAEVCVYLAIRRFWEVRMAKESSVVRSSLTAWQRRTRRERRLKALPGRANTCFY